jgi:hypothetical protein
MASIAFTDTIGAVTITNGRSAPADRFANWIPITAMDGARRQGPGMDAPAAFILREHYGVQLEFPYIPATEFAKLDRLKRHLEYRGGSCSLTTGDNANRVYATCCVFPGREVSWSFDGETQEFTLSLAVANRAAVPGPMLCVY